LKNAIKAINAKEYSIGHPSVSLFWYDIDTKQGDFSMKGGSGMNQQEFHEKLNEAREIQDRAMKMAEESKALMEVDFKKSNEMFVESMELWDKGCMIALDAMNEAIESGLMAFAEKRGKKLCEICSEK
jgi:hypothetical protein